MENQNSKAALIKFLFAVSVFGTIGVFRRFIPLDSGLIAMTRGLLGAVFIFVYLKLTGRPFSFKRINRKSAFILIFNGAVMGFNWIALFESYNFTSVSTATLCYYMQPVFLILIGAVLFKEKLTWKKALCVFVAVIGMVFVSGVLSSGISPSDGKGILLGLVSGFLYAAVVSISRTVSDVDPYEKTSLQLLSAGVVVIPYLIIKGVFSNPSQLAAQFTPLCIIMLLIVCIFHTGIIYTMYFGSIDKLKVQEVAILGYLDPVVAIILSHLILHESMGWTGLVGAVLILGAAIGSELWK